jgi:phosphocarrier protein
MVTRFATVRNEYGIHCRPSSVIAREAMSYPGTITVRTATGQANAKSVLEMVSLAAGPGEQVTISVKGPDEEATAHRFVGLFETHFEFSK